MSYHIQLFKEKKCAVMKVKGEIKNTAQSYSLHNDIVKNFLLIMGVEKLLIDLKELDGRFLILNLLEKADRTLSQFTRINSAILEDLKNKSESFFHPRKMCARKNNVLYFFDSNEADQWLKEC